MEKSVKQVVVSAILEAVAKIVFFSLLIFIVVALFLEVGMTKMSLEPYLMGINEIGIGIFLMCLVYFSYDFYKKIDQFILRDFKALMENIKYDKYLQPVNIFELKKIQDELIRKNKEIENRNQFVSKTISFISHDMKTPVTVINANINLLKKNKDVISDLGQARISRIEVETQKVSEYIASLMDITTNLTTVDKKEKIGIEDCIRKTQNSIRIYSDSIEEEIEIDCGLEYLMDMYLICDYKKLDKCMIHLLNNAFEHRKNKVRIQVDFEGSYLLFKVIDDGVGFNPESLEKAVEMFYTSNFGRTSGKGYGIGLYFVNTYMESIKGKLVLVNGELGGAEQILKIPIFRGRVDE